MLGDGRTKYDNDNDGNNNKLGGCESDFRRTDGATTKGRLTYSRETSSLNVSRHLWNSLMCESRMFLQDFYLNSFLPIIAPRQSQLKIQTKFWDQWDDCFTLQDIKLPEMPYLGFSAHTGEVHDNHDIISVTTSTMIKAPQLLGHVRI